MGRVRSTSSPRSDSESIHSGRAAADGTERLGDVVYFAWPAHRNTTATGQDHLHDVDRDLSAGVPVRDDIERCPAAECAFDLASRARDRTSCSQHELLRWTFADSRASPMAV